MSTKTSALPDVIDAFHEAKQCHSTPERFRWSHRFIYEAACKTGFTRLRNENSITVFPAFASHYQEILNSNQEKVNAHSNSMAEVSKLSSHLDIDPGLLYYLTKPKGSEMRKYLRTRSIETLASNDQYCWLPE